MNSFEHISKGRKAVIAMIMILMISASAVFIASDQSDADVNVTSVTIPGGDREIYVGDSLKLDAHVYPSDATNRNVTWSSSNSKTVRVGTDGTITGMEKGKATITVTTEDGGKTASIKVTVYKHVRGISVETPTMEITDTSYHQIEYQITPEDAKDKSVTWYSSNRSVATVNSEGFVRGVGYGDARITVSTNDGNFKAYCDVHVDIKVTEVTLSKSTIEFKEITSNAVKLDAKVMPESAHIKDVVWTSADPTIANVDKDGWVVPIKRGFTEITVTTVDGGYTAVCKVVVSEKSEGRLYFYDGNTLLEEIQYSETTGDVVIPQYYDRNIMGWSDSKYEQVVEYLSGTKIPVMEMYGDMNFYGVTPSSGTVEIASGIIDGDVSAWDSKLDSLYDAFYNLKKGVQYKLVGTESFAAHGSYIDSFLKIGGVIQLAATDDRDDVQYEVVIKDRAPVVETAVFYNGDYVSETFYEGGSIVSFSMDLSFDKTHMTSPVYLVVDADSLGGGNWDITFNGSKAKVTKERSEYSVEIPGAGLVDMKKSSSPGPIPTSDMTLYIIIGAVIAILIVAALVISRRKSKKAPSEEADKEE